MRHFGFIFSLDAFVAFTLIMVTVGMLIFIIGTPKPFYPELEQAHQLAHDTLQALATSSDVAGGQTYLEQIIGDSSKAKPILYKIAGGNDTYPGLIPKGFGYKLERYNFASGSWVEIYDAGKDCSSSSPSDRCGKNFTKLRASAAVFASFYEIKPEPGQSPYCYLSCFGYPNQNQDVCKTVPCNVSKSNMQIGNHSIQLIRLVVYT